VVVAFAAVLPATAQHVDILAEVSGNRLSTGEFSLEDDSRRENVRVFAAVLPNDAPAERVFTQSPGFSALTASGLPPGSLLGFDVLGPLEYWAGHGPVELGPSVDNEALRISVGPLFIEVNATSAPTPGFEIARITDQETLHRHPTYWLLGDGAAGDPSLPMPTPGIYAVPLALRSSEPAIEPSLPFWLVFDYGGGHAARAAAVSWIDDYRVQGLIPGDADGDGRVDLNDFGLLKQSFGLAGNRAQGDFNGDRFVDLTDFGLLKQNFGAARPSADVPEPSAAALALFGLLALMGRGQRGRRDALCSQ
jgi:hypothetical protein